MSKWYPFEESVDDIENLPSSSTLPVLSLYENSDILPVESAGQRFYENAIVISSDEDQSESHQDISDRKGKRISRGQDTKGKTPNKDQKSKKREKNKNGGKKRRREEQISHIAEYDDFDLDAAVEALIKPTKKPFTESVESTVECPVCSRMFSKSQVEQHASDCTGAYSDTEENEPLRRREKNTIAASVARHEAERKRNRNDSFVENVNYYAESEDLLAANGTSLTWESRGQMRFS
ncbi:hypothetical protein G6F61_001346 [Rhizopus arrhizus]|nr:hypothetical protein G6F61_001346 [Rhizopus arrhizus]